jgi:hypothetical protein
VARKVEVLEVEGIVPRLVVVSRVVVVLTAFELHRKNGGARD